MDISDYAVIKNGDDEVINVIVADDSFSLDGYYLIKIDVGQYVAIGMHFNKKSGKFS